MADLSYDEYGSFYTGNRFLSREEMEHNANYIRAFLTARGWSINAVCGMLGNMQTESTINPGIWQNLTEADSNGFGLVQWTPSTKYIGWCNNRSLVPSFMGSALQRIEWEVANGEQWIITSDYPMTFEEFKTSTKSPYDLAMAFLRNYERPADQNQPTRGHQASQWYDFFDLNGDINHGGGNTHTKKKMGFLLLLTATRRRF